MLLHKRIESSNDYVIIIDSNRCFKLQKQPVQGMLTWNKRRSPSSPTGAAARRLSAYAKPLAIPAYGQQLLLNTLITMLNPCHLLLFMQNYMLRDVLLTNFRAHQVQQLVTYSRGPGQLFLWPLTSSFQARKKDTRSNKLQTKLTCKERSRNIISMQQTCNEVMEKFYFSRTLYKNTHILSLCEISLINRCGMDLYESKV